MSRRSMHGLPGIYNATPLSLTDEDGVALATDSSGRLKLAAESASTPIYIKDASTGTDILKVNATGAAAIATSTAIAAEWKLLAVTVHFSSAPTTSQNLTMTLNAVAGAAYDTILYSVDPSLSAATDVVYIPDGEMKFFVGDELDIAFTNTDTRTYGLTIYYQLI